MVALSYYGYLDNSCGITQSEQDLEGQVVQPRLTRQPARSSRIEHTIKCSEIISNNQDFKGAIAGS